MFSLKHLQLMKTGKLDVEHCFPEIVTLISVTSLPNIACEHSYKQIAGMKNFAPPIKYESLLCPLVVECIGRVELNFALISRHRKV